jgi:hypothetical protein
MRAPIDVRLESRVVGAGSLRTGPDDDVVAGQGDQLVSHGMSKAALDGVALDRFADSLADDKAYGRRGLRGSRDGMHHDRRCSHAAALTNGAPKVLGMA